jgi:hypothetical protein
MFVTGFAAVALNSDSNAPKHAKVLSKPIHLRELVHEVQKMPAQKFKNNGLCKSGASRSSSPVMPTRANRAYRRAYVSAAPIRRGEAVSLTGHTGPIRGDPFSRRMREHGGEIDKPGGSGIALPNFKRRKRCQQLMMAGTFHQGESNSDKSPSDRPWTIKRTHANRRFPCKARSGARSVSTAGPGRHIDDPRAAALANMFERKGIEAASVGGLNLFDKLTALSPSSLADA